jgi:hypothetical protein
MHSYLSFLFPSIFWAYSETWEIANSDRGLCPPCAPQGTLSPVSPLAYGMKVYVRAYGASAFPFVKKVLEHIHKHTNTQR